VKRQPSAVFHNTNTQLFVVLAVLALIATSVGCGTSAQSASTQNAMNASSISVTGVSPAFGPGSGGSLITIAGKNFRSGMTVKVGGAAAGSITVSSSNQLNAVTPAHSLGVVDIVVASPDGEAAVLSSAFTYASGRGGKGGSGSFNLSVSKSGGGTVLSNSSDINCGPNCSADFPKGTMVSMTAQPDAGYYFSGWKGDCSGAGACTVSVNSDVNVTANFLVSGSGTTYWLSTSGNDGDSGLAPNAAFATFYKAVKVLRPGDTLIVRNGTYNSSNSGYPNVDCNNNTVNGKASAHITIQAENERQAFIKGDGSNSPFAIQNCSYWDVIGLHMENGDFNNNGGGDANYADVFYAYNTDHLTLKRNIAARNNRYGNSHLYDLYHTTYSTMEENEGYYFHRHAVLDMQGSNSTFRRNYFNSRGYADISGGRYSTNTTRGDGAVVLYPSSYSIAENNISEGQDRGVEIQCAYTDSGCYNDQLLGNVSLGDNYGILLQARGLTDGTMPHNTDAENAAIINPLTVGFYARAAKNAACHSCTILGSSSTQEGFDSDGNESDWAGDGNYSAYAYNVLSTSSSGGSSYGFYMAGGTWTIDHPGAYDNDVNFYPKPPNPNIISPNTNQPSLGSCKVWIPENSPMNGAGTGGKDIGANVLYEYVGGVLTQQPLWDRSSGAFRGCGELVSGLNDKAGSSCFDVQNRLNVNTNGCYFPSNY